MSPTGQGMEALWKVGIIIFIIEIDFIVVKKTMIDGNLMLLC